MQEVLAGAIKTVRKVKLDAGVLGGDCFDARTLVGTESGWSYLQ
jgi:hypothetical protein